ncbi:phosphoadenosine phosphosulfate reductase family protein [Siphonobacter sp. SORGH_AS_0500]|uniref:phosphoadenosine phosphosulfate reductase domain-containing protein n=1 Tax=Siphonobacter sp. SORGH_AS_0500 TaxID=1864824 RepID=UPI0028678145|nr:phosphoadenosine phosphosulfate reductase family protein [Siphonobacter sp. SORGH_AS_0500]MDR6195660.1 3'-phosphoadenosine 5'-phosphosulfate sulfotransferase (PAPS reductase)/FAD synthetase [Siphonobacter sp. SORGH_AS_0500]
MTSSRLTVISFSGGRSSAMMTKRMIDSGKYENRVIVFANTGKERHETLDFVHECDIRWNLGVVWLEYDPATKFRITSYENASRNGEPFTTLLSTKVYLPNRVKRYCTGELKVKPIKRYIQSLGVKNWDNAMGIRYDEPLRWGKMIQNTQHEPWFNVLPLYEDEIVKADVSAFWRSQDFDLQLESYQGNCDLCFMKGKKKLTRLIRENPDSATWWLNQESQVGGTFRQRESYSRLVEYSNQPLEPSLFDFEPDYPCHCNID